MEKNIREQILRWAKKFKAIELLGGKCKCGVDNPLILEFHHDNEDKESTVSNLIKYRWSIIEKEFSKCILLCANCHMELHFSEYKNTDQRKRLLKIKLLELKGQTKCIKCGHDAPCSLDFHHFSDKKFDISDYVYYRWDMPIEEVLVEMEKCNVFCRNCHRIEHFGSSFNEILPLIKKKMETYKELQKPLDRNEVYSKYDQGMSRIEISRLLKCAKSTISMIIRDRKKGIENKV